MTEWSLEKTAFSSIRATDATVCDNPKADGSIAKDPNYVSMAEPTPSVTIPPQNLPDKWAIHVPRLLVSTNLTLQKFHVLKWKEIARLARLITAPCFHRVRLAGDDHALYESFYRSFPHEMVAKARFTGVTRAVFGVDADATLPREKLLLCRHLEAMQYVYELSSDNIPMLNWRLLLIGLHFFQYPLQSMREHMAWGFRVFGSVGFLDALSDNMTIQTSDLALMLTQLLRNQASGRLVSERLRQAQVLEPTATLTPSNVRKRMNAKRMSYQQFQELLLLPPLQPLFDKATEHTIVLEELATPLYRDLVFRKRKKDSDRKKIERLRYFHRTKRLRRAFFMWMDVARILKRTRVIMIAAFHRLLRVKKTHAFTRLKRHAIQSWAATEIQRFVRGMAGRRVAADKWSLVQAAIKVQGAFRMRSHFVRFLQDMRRRHRATIHIQRVYRGRVGRVVTKTMLQSYYYCELEKIQRDRECFHDMVRGEMARRIQRVFHKIVARQKEARAAQEARQRHLVELEMLNVASEATRQVQRHKNEVTTTYDKLREAHEYKLRRKEIDGAEKAKVIRLRRQRQWDAFKSERVAVRERQKREAANAHTALQTEWHTKNEERVRHKRLFLSQILDLEEPGEWKTLQKQLKGLVTNREKELQLKYKQSQVVVPKREVHDRAKIEIIDEEVEKERVAAEAEWLKAESDFFYDLDVQEEERMMSENVEERRRREKSAIKMQSAFRMFAARKKLKAEIRECFVKEFDVKTQLPKYRNTRERDPPSARKPFGLGPDDLDYPDQWVLIDDDIVGQPFFYHPQTLRQSWETPYECQCCNNCGASHRIVFAAYWNAEEDSYHCLDCYNKRLDTSTFNVDSYFPYDGSKRGGY